MRMDKQAIEALGDTIFGAAVHSHVCHCHILPDAEYQGEAKYSLNVDVLPRLKVNDINLFVSMMGLNPMDVNVFGNGSMTISWVAGRCSDAISASSRAIVVERACLDWDFDEDEQKIYKFSVDRKLYNFASGDKVALDVWGRPGTGLVTGTILKVQPDSIIVRADNSLDISEEYSITLLS